MNKKTLVGGLATYILILGLNFSLFGQNSPWELRVGYENLFVRPETTNYYAEKTWVWNIPERGDVFTARTSRTHATILGIKYDVKKWLSISLDYKLFIRRYYIEGGTYTDGTFELIPSVGTFEIRSMNLGRTMTASSYQFGLDFSHRLGKNDKWRIHYYLSANNDLYEKQLQYFDNNVFLDLNGWYIDETNSQRYEDYVRGFETWKSTNRGRSSYQPSTNLAIALSRKMKKGMGLKLEVGFRNILWIENALLKENHIEFDLMYVESIKQDDGSLIQTFERSVLYDFPLYLGGIYSNISFTFRPFRSPRDKAGYISRFKRLKLYLKKKRSRNE